MSRPLGILISGRGSNMVALVEALREGTAAHPVIVLSNRPEAGGLARAEALGVPTSVVDHRAYPDRESFERAMDARLREAGAELVAHAGFMRILTPWFARAWASRMLNIHPSLLPLWPGLDTHAKALAAGVALHGCTVHEVTEALDGGPILGQAAVAVRPGDTEETLAARVLAQEHRLYPMVLQAFARDPEAARTRPVALFGAETPAL
ncbi:MAG: phosphoribosylglycinamide formyltransferase [Pseudomonadota bacterium]